ncbi:N-acetylglucosamine-6-phosphate deacetylase [Pelagibacterium xiamenense]|uniref:N-acetylglucosamine-6-phosphate deacetylase n=1 Tax=Pelagibacterium xiamenense TaxID=2901140 RepID=UPI001E391AA8|nr:N-acetylglucosamine-6-phosphate deacetylase [Pelagibacterium xiamenense]MCD7058813.1 N-acetylglucosamine-6-phosphate deacetylase [Pelagibacterium xiamenense]
MRTGNILSGAAIFDGESWHQGRALVLRDGIVDQIAADEDHFGDLPRIEFDGGLIVPGFVDLQVNGGGGVLFNDHPDAQSLATLCAAHFPFGTTALLPTLITDTPEVTQKALDAGMAAQRQGVPGFAGLHIEGPHLSVARKGAHNPDFIRPMEPGDLARLVAAKAGLATLLTTVAVESVAPEQITALAEAGVIVSLGHTDASRDDAVALFSAGATMVTHLFNAMSQLGNREPGLVGAALSSGVWAGLIADGIHVDAAGIGIALRAKEGPGRVFLVTDAMSTIGTELGRFTLNGREIVRANGALRLADGTLAGADLTMIDAVRFMHRVLGLPLEEVLRMASLYPAQAIGRQGEMGHLMPGARANLVHLDDDLNITGVWIDGARMIG